MSFVKGKIEPHSYAVLDPIGHTVQSFKQFGNASMATTAHHGAKVRFEETAVMFLGFSGPFSNDCEHLFAQGLPSTGHPYSSY